ncbi:MAG: efflux RND transporter permease subunit [Leptospirales bacterium]|nr:efflux RND transporter permease subunit [Leptospirales bacterium]
MNLASLSIKRPIFISSIVILMLAMGGIALNRLGIDLFPKVTFPYVLVTTTYLGAGPEEVENLISRPIEEQLSSIAGIKRVSSRNQEGLSVVIAEFTLQTDIKYAEQQVRDKVGTARVDFPADADESLVLRFDPDDQPILRLSLQADLPPAKLYDLANETVKPLLEQVGDVGGVRLLGGARREIQLELDRNRLNSYRISAVRIANQLRNSGLNVPVGRFESGAQEISFRTLGEFSSIEDIRNTTVSFGADIGSGVTIGELGQVRDATEDTKAIGYFYAPLQDRPHPGLLRNLIGGDTPQVERQLRPALFIDAYKQSGSNTVAVVDALLKRVGEINQRLASGEGKPRIIVVRDSSLWIRYNIEDVATAIVLGIVLAVVVVYFFLGNLRSTIITGLALPNSLLGAFLLMYVMGFTINVMTLLALSLCIGLLVDDAIVVRENIFRKIEEGLPPREAAEKGTTEVTLAVIATTATVIAVFLPVGFLTGIIGQFFKEFGLTVVFAMLISLFDALTIAPMLSANFAGGLDHKRNFLLRAFDRYQDWQDRLYERAMAFTLRRKKTVIAISVGVFVLSLLSLGLVKRTFLPPNDQGEFQISFELKPGASLEGTRVIVDQVVQKLQNEPLVEKMAIVIGNENAESNVANIGIQLVPSGERRISTVDFKSHVREMLAPFHEARARVADYSAVGGGVQYPFNLNLRGEDLQVLDAYASKLVERMRNISDLTDLDSSFRPGKPEFQVVFDQARMQAVGVAPVIAGQELRYHVAGGVVGKLRQNGLEYDIRLRLRPEQRNLRAAFSQTMIPNLNFQMIPLPAISVGRENYGPARISRENRARVVTINANLSPGGALDSATEQVKKLLDREMPPPPGVTYAFIGQAEDLRELIANIILAFGIALLFIYLVLASLYESFVTPFTIISALPTAISGAFFALAITGEFLNIFSMIGVILLMGLVTKNSILLVDRAMENMRHRGMDRDAAIFEAGQVRLRPILMTTFAMIAGTLPVALGLGEAAKSRTAMGIAIIGGLFISTLVTLLLVPAIFAYIDRLREFLEGLVTRASGDQASSGPHGSASASNAGNGSLSEEEVRRSSYPDLPPEFGGRRRRRH